MTYFQGTKTCITNLQKYLPDSYHLITHTLVAEMLLNENYLQQIHTIQISTCKRFLSLCFDTRDTLLQFADTDHILLDTPISFEPEYYQKIHISIENIPIELPDDEVKIFLSTYTKTIKGKTYYPGIKHSNNFITTGTRIYQCIKINHHIPRRIFYFGRYLRIRYNEQPQDNNQEQQLQQTDNEDKTQQSQQTDNELQDINELQPQTLLDEQQLTNESEPPEDEQNTTENIQTQHTPIPQQFDTPIIQHQTQTIPKTQQQTPTTKTDIPILDTDLNDTPDNHPLIKVTKRRKKLQPDSPTTTSEVNNSIWWSTPPTKYKNMNDPKCYYNQTIYTIVFQKKNKNVITKKRHK